MFKKFRGNKKAYIIRIFFAALIFILSILAFLPDYKPFTAIMELNPGPAVAKWISDFSIITLIVVLLHFAIAFLFGRFYCSTVCPFGILQDIIGGIFNRKSGKTKNFYYIIYTIVGIRAARTAPFLLPEAQRLPGRRAASREPLPEKRREIRN